MTFWGRKWGAGVLVCLAALAVGCGGGIGTGALQITTTGLPAGNVGNAYSTVVGADGGTLPFTWSLTSGTLPAGLTFGTGTGSIAGLPAAAGTTTLTVTVTDSSSPVETATAKLTLLIGSLQIAVNNVLVGVGTTSLPSGTVGTAYSQALQTVGGTGPYTWSVTLGALPLGLSLNTSTGAITGTPTVGGVSNFTLQVSDSESPSVSTTANFSISASPLELLNSSLPNGLQGTPYSFTLDAVGGDPPYTWSIVSGSGTLPQGLTLNTTTGQISGTPAQPGTSLFKVHVQDSEGTPESVTQTTQLTIASSTSACANAPRGNEALLKGNYAFLAQGFEGGSSGSPVAIAGSFAASNGQITGGEVDVSDATDSSTGDNHYTIAPYTAAAPVSSYTVGLDLSSSGNVGCVMLTTSVGTTMTFHFSLGGVSGGVTSRGKIIEFDDTSGAGTIASGVMALQDSTAFSVSNLSSHYAFGMDGETSTGKPLAASGSFSVASGGKVSGLFADVDIAGTNSSGLSGGSGSISGISSTDGRGAASFSASSQSFAWTVYIVNANEAYLVSTASPAGGRMLATGSSFPASLAGSYVVYTTGITTCGNSPCADVNLGLLDFTGGGAVSGPVWDYNVSAGESQGTVTGGTYSVAASSGRVTFTNVGSNGIVGYLVSPQVDGINAVLVGNDAAAHSGFATLQSATSLPGESVIYGTLDPRYNSARIYAGTAVILGSGALSGTEDSSSQSAKLAAGSAVARTVSLVSNGTGSAASGGGTNVAVTDGTRLFWFDYGGGAPAVITVAEPQ